MGSSGAGRSVERFEGPGTGQHTTGNSIAEPTTAPLHGCRSTHIYCLPTCRYDRRVLERNRIQFASAVEAVAAGYRACKVCKPPLPDA